MSRPALRLWPRSLGGQLVALLLIALVLAQVFTLWIFAGERRGALIEMARTTFLSRTVSLVRLIETTPPQQHDEVLRAVSSPILLFRIADAPALETSGNHPAERRLKQMLQSELGAERAVRVDVVPAPRLRLRRDDHDDDDDDHDRDRRGRSGALSLTMSVALDDGRWLNAATRFRLPKHTILPLLVSIGLMAGFIVAIVAVTVRRLTRPLRDLASAADRLGRGEDVDAIPETGPSEVRGTIRAFNAMQDRLTRFVRDRTRMLAAISHDLRTPITSLRLRAEFIDDEENRERIIATLDEMQRMVEATLSFARDEASREQAARIDLGEFIDAIAEDYRDMGATVTFTPPATRLVTRVRPLSLKRALRNLIDNAVRYGEAADIALTRDDSGLRIAVRDRGPGIPQERLNDVFDPFVRLEESRSEDTGGIGLGLSIARSIVHAHGGGLALRNRPEGGLEACITLPSDAAGRV